jgi:hypothetical protein
LAEVAVLPSAAEKVVSVPQDDSDSGGEGHDNGEGSSSDNGDGKGSSNDNGEDKAMHIPFRTTPSGIMWFKCPICLGTKFDSEAKVVLHALDVIKQDAGMPDVVEWHR